MAKTAGSVDAEWPIPPARVTIAIEGWNAADLESRALFERSLESLQRQSYPVARCEVLILIAGDEPAENPDWYQRWIPHARLVPVPGGTYYRAKNAAIRASRREVLAFADSDVRYEPGWLAAMLASLRPGIDLVAGHTRYEPGFLSRTLDLCDWAATRKESGFTDWFYGNNVAMRRDLLETVHFREDIGISGGGSVNVLRAELLKRGIRFWFCAEARAWHHLAPFLVKRLRVGAYHVRHRQIAANTRAAWVVRVPLLGPFLATGGTLVAAWRRAWRLRSTLPAGGLSLPIYLVTIALVKGVEAIGAAAYAWAPGWTGRRSGWFAVPEIGPSG